MPMPAGGVAHACRCYPSHLRRCAAEGNRWFGHADLALKRQAVFLYRFSAESIQGCGVAAVGGAAECAPDVEVDVVGNEAGGAVAEGGVDAGIMPHVVGTSEILTRLVTHN